MFSGAAALEVDSAAGKPTFTVGDSRSPLTHLQAREIWSLRKAREDYFPDALFSDPAWDILLFLYATELGGQRSCVTSTVGGSNVPEATAIRWIGRLIDAGLCEKTADPLDRRRHFISLTVSGKRAMDDYFIATRTLRIQEFVRRMGAEKGSLNNRPQNEAIVNYAGALPC